MTNESSDQRRRSSFLGQFKAFPRWLHLALFGKDESGGEREEVW